MILAILFSLSNAVAGDTYYTQSHTFVVSEKALETLDINVTGLDAKGVKILDSADLSTKIEIDVAGVSDHQSDVEHFSVSIDHTLETESKISWSANSYKCLYLFKNGVLSKLKGFCVIAARLYLPKKSTTLVTVSKKVIHGSIQKVSMLIEAIQSETFSSDKEKVLKSFVDAKRAAKSGRYITAAEVITIIQLFGTFDGEKVAKAFSGYVIDPENVTKDSVEPHVSTFDVDEVVELLKK